MYSQVQMDPCMYILFKILLIFSVTVSITCQSTEIMAITIHTKSEAQYSHIILLQCGLALVNLTKILQGFITDTGQAWGCSSDNWATLRQINSLRLSDTHMCQYNIWTLVQIMACRLFGAKPLSEPMLSYYQLDLKGHISVKFHLKFWHFHSVKCTSKFP